MLHLYTLSKHIFIFFIFSILIFAIYSNTFYASWHFDDLPNIVKNYYLHISSLHPDTLVKTFFTDPRNPERLSVHPYRPISCLTFALNWYFGQDNVVGYHIVNTAIHVFTAFFLFLFILTLFNTPNLKNNRSGNPFFIAFLASVLWAANPIQTQAVTYIVQRMTQLAALFYLFGLFAYLKARLSSHFNRRVLWLSMCLMFYLLGINSKPNAAMMPVAVLLLEITFFQNHADGVFRKKVFFSTAIIAGIVILAGSVTLFQGELFSFFSDFYDKRTFTLTERLLTQPRIVLFYLSQIFYPLPDRFSIAHDVVLSASFFKPWTTPASFLIVIVLLGFSFFQIKNRPTLSFSILFFFLNHIIESTVIPIELIFEHRNYLPSFFLFLPIASSLNYLLFIYKKNKAVYSLTVFLTLTLVIFFSISTYVRNLVWKDDITLWMDAMSKAPNDARTSNNLAVRLAWGDNSQHPRRYDMALKLLEDSIEKHLPSTVFKADILGNMALIHFYKKKNFQTGFMLFDKALEVDPENLKIRHDLVDALIIKKQFDAAIKHVEFLLTKNSENGIYFYLKGHVLLWQGAYEQALSCFKKAYDLVWDKTSIIFATSVALTLSGCHEKAETLMNHAIKQYPDYMFFYFAAIENSIRAGEKVRTAEYKKKLFEQFSKHQIKQGVDTYTDNPKYAPISREIIAPIILNNN